MNNQRIILHLDMNSYFASVEQQANPFLRGRPVGICAYLSTNGCIIASSVEAKKVGIKTGCRVYEAKKLYPKVALIENNPDKYRFVTKKIFGILQQYTDSFEPYSIDEAFLDLTGWVRDFNEAEALARKIRSRIKNEVGEWLKMSIGISFTKFLAKLCSDTAAADEIMVIKSQDELEPLYQRLALTDLWGINYRLEERLNRLGIKTPNDLKKYPVANLLEILGKTGYYLWAKVNGQDFEQLERDVPKSIGHSYCLPKKTTDKAYLAAILFKLCWKISKRLLDKELVASGISLFWSCLDDPGFHASKKISQPIVSGLDIFQPAHEFLKREVLNSPVSMLAVSVFNLSSESKQLTLFDLDQRKNRLARVVAEINGRYGDQSLIFGRLWGLANQAVDRIGFRKVDGLVEDL